MDRFTGTAVAFALASTASFSACAPDTTTIALPQAGDTIQFSVPWDSISENVDTMLISGDTVVVTVTDTVLSPPDTVLIPVVDTVINGNDTVFVNSTDTIVSIDTVIVTTVDTVVTVDTIIVVDTVISPPPTLDFGVNSLELPLGASRTVSVTVVNALGVPVPVGTVTWLSGDPSIASVNQNARVTGVTEGSTDIFAIADAEGLSASLPVSVVDTTTIPPPPPPAQGVWFEEDWDYADTNQLLADPNGWLFRYPNAPIDLVVDPTAPWASRKAFVVRMNPSAGSGGFDITFPAANAVRPREIWQETWIKFSPDWRTNWNKPGNPDHKTFQWYDQDETGSKRWSLKFGVFGGAIQASATASYFLGVDGPSPVQQLDLPSEMWDGEWHRVRVHLSMGSGNGSDGIYRLMIDGNTLASDFAANTSAHGPNDYFRKTALGRNLNQVPDIEMEVYYGQTRVWISDPGWNW